MWQFSVTVYLLKPYLWFVHLNACVSESPVVFWMWRVFFSCLMVTLWMGSLMVTGEPVWEWLELLQNPLKLWGEKSRCRKCVMNNALAYCIFICTVFLHLCVCIVWLVNTQCLQKKSGKPCLRSAGADLAVKLLSRECMRKPGRTLPSPSLPDADNREIGMYTHMMNEQRCSHIRLVTHKNALYPATNNEGYDVSLFFIFF